MNTTDIVKGSIAAIAQQKHQSIAKTFVDVDAVVMVDVSRSMSSEDSRDGKSRYMVALEELAAIQERMPGKIAIIGFSHRAEFCPGGQPVFFGQGTDMTEALKLAKILDVQGIRFIMISDGEPADADETLKIAKTYKNKIDTVFVGPEDRPFGRDFLSKLAKASGGQAVNADRAQELASQTLKLLAA